MSEHAVAQPIKKSLLTPGVFVMTGLAALAGLIVLYRLIFGLSTVTNLDNFYPWGIWIGVDVASGVALAAGGFTTAFLAHIIHRHNYEAIVRPALLTALLGYTFVGLGVFTDLGRYYNIWHLMLPTCWQGNSALFEVGACVMMYLTVLYIEFAPVVVERFMGKVNIIGELSFLNKPIEALLRIADRALNKTIFIFAILGVCLSCAHQSSLGTLLTIAPSKVHPLWWTPFMPLLFLFSAFAVGFPMVIFESMWAHKSFGMKPDMKVLSPLARIVPFTIGLYLILKIWDLLHRSAYVYLDDFTWQTNMFLVEIVLGVIVPFVMFTIPKVRKTPALAFTAAALFVCLGVLLNRVNVFVTSYTPPFADHRYVPHFLEFMVTIGYIAALMLLYRIFVTIFPVIVHHKEPPPLKMGK